MKEKIKNVLVMVNILLVMIIASVNDFDLKGFLFFLMLIAIAVINGIIIEKLAD